MLRNAIIFCLFWFPLGTRGAEPLLRQIEPVGVQRGGEVRLVLRGERLGPAPCHLLMDGSGVVVRRLRSLDAQRVEADVVVAIDAPLGAHAVRLQTPYGLSNLLTFHVGDLVLVDEQEPNNDPLAPQAIELGTRIGGLEAQNVTSRDADSRGPMIRGATLSGVVQSEDVDYFAVEAMAGERLSIEIEGVRLGRTLFDPAITLFDSQMQKIAASDDEPLTRQDGFLSIVVPQTGVYHIEVREAAWRGDDDCRYWLHVGSFPRPAALFPPGGRLGEALELRWIGDACDDFVRSVRLPERSEGNFAYFASDRRGTSPSPLPIRATPFGNALEIEPNDLPREATPGEAPIGFCGIVSRAGDVDLFRFSAKQSVPLDVRVFARQLGSPLDSLLRIRSADGKNIVGNDDERSKPDSYLRFNPPADGDYLVEVSDHLGRGGSHYVYRAELTPIEPSVDVRVEEARRFVSQTIDVPQGGRTAALVRLTRRDVAGALQAAIENLPTGVTVETRSAPADTDRVPVVFHAAPDAPLASSMATIRAISNEQNQQFVSRFVQQSWLVRSPKNVAVWSYFGDRLPVAATLPTPFAVRVQPPRAPLVQNGALQLNVEVDRTDDFLTPIAVSLLYNPPGITSVASQLIPRGETSATLLITASNEAALRTWDLVVVARANSNGRRVACSEFFPLRIAEPHLDLRLTSVTANAGSACDYLVEIEPHVVLEGIARIELRGLPEGVTTQSLEIDAQSRSIVFPLQIAPEARLGRHTGLFCQVFLTDQGEAIEYRCEGGTLQIDGGE